MIIKKEELALYVINLKIAKEIKENEETEYQNFRKKIINLQNERDEIYKGNQEVINKILTKYMKEMKE